MTLNLQQTVSSVRTEVVLILFADLFPKPNMKTQYVVSAHKNIHITELKTSLAYCNLVYIFNTIASFVLVTFLLIINLLSN